MILLVLVVISKTYMASKSAHRLLATYNSSTDFRFCPLHSAIIFSRSSIDFSSAAIRASLGEKGKKKKRFPKLLRLLRLYRGYSSQSWANTAFVELPQRLLSPFPTLPPVICFPALSGSYIFSSGFISLALRSDWLIVALTGFAQVLL